MCVCVCACVYDVKEVSDIANQTDRNSFFATGRLVCSPDVYGEDDRTNKSSHARHYIQGYAKGKVHLCTYMYI